MFHGPPSAKFASNARFRIFLPKPNVPNGNNVPKAHLMSQKTKKHIGMIKHHENPKFLIHVSSKAKVMLIVKLSWKSDGSSNFYDFFFRASKKFLLENFFFDLKARKLGWSWNFHIKHIFCFRKGLTMLDKWFVPICPKIFWKKNSVFFRAPK